MSIDYKKQRDDLLAFIQQAPVASGVCCCGDNVEGHNATDHNPVDMWDHAVLSFVEAFAKADAAEAALATRCRAAGGMHATTEPETSLDRLAPPAKEKA